MKILFAGPIDKGQTAGMRMDALRELGHTIIPFNSLNGWNQASRISRRIQQLFAAGPIVKKINSDVLKLAMESKPNLIWAEKQEYLYPQTLKKFSDIGIKTLHFTPDPYFTLTWKQTRLTRACMPLYDYTITSKKYELSEYERVCKRTIYMPLGFAESVHRPLFPLDAQLRRTYFSDVSFVGGWEPRREELLEAIARETGCNLKIWGYGWDFLMSDRWSLRRWLAMKQLSGNEPFRMKRNDLLANAVQGNEIYADAYAYALSGSKISIGFLRKVCPDQHTTRTFEIPACGSMLLADRTDEHRGFFVEGKEAEFFSDKKELIEKVRFYLSREDLRKKIAFKGYEKCLAAGYSYKNRLKDVLAEIA